MIPQQRSRLSPLVPRQELPECLSAMAVVRFFLWPQLGEGLLNRWKVKQRIVAETVTTAKGVENQAIRLSAKHFQNSPVSGRRDHADETAGAFFPGNAPQLSDQTSVVRLVISVVVLQVWSFCRIARGMHARRSAEGIDFQSGIVGQNDFSGNIAAVPRCLFSRVFFKRDAVLDDRRQGSEVREGVDLNSDARSGPGEIPQLTRIGRGDEHTMNHDFGQVTSALRVACAGITRVRKAVPSSPRISRLQEFGPRCG